MATDPFSWGARFADTQHQRAAQESAQGQNALMSVFAAEARRQAPWSDLPTDLAKQNNQYDLSLRNSMAVANYKASMKPAMAPAKIANVVKSTAKAYGDDADYYLTLADVESSFRANAQNKSGASGLFQFMPGTAQQYGLADPFDVTQSTDAAIRLTRDNRRVLEKAGIKPTPGALYLAHQQGAGGAVKLLSNPDVPAESIVGRAAVVQNGGRPGMSAQQFANMWMSKFDRNYQSRIAQRAKSQQQVVEYDLGDGTTLDMSGVQPNLEDTEDTESL